jgi:ADP-ribose pyrophosphatase
LEKDFIEKDGSSYTYLTVWTKGTKKATMILPITTDKKIVVIREYRVWIEGLVNGFPVGILERYLSPTENCKKELSEETWYKSNNFTKLGSSIIEGYQDGSVHYFLATDCIVWESNLEVGENIEVYTTTLIGFEKLIIDGTINCPLSLSCYTLAKAKWLL